MKKSMRPDKLKFDLIESRNVPSNIIFNDSLFGHKRSLYKDRLVEAAQCDKTIVILKTDKYLLQQLKTAAKKLKLRLTYGTNADNLYIKVMQLEGELKRLFLVLREPRTLNELQSRKFELDLDTTLKYQVDKGNLKFNGKGYILSETGLSMIATNA